MGGQRSAIVDVTSFAYAAPVIDALEPARGVASDGGMLTVTGREFAHVYALEHRRALGVRWGNTPLDIVSIGERAIVVAVGAGLERDAQLHVTHHVGASDGAAEVARSEGVRVDYASPSIRHAHVVLAETSATSAQAWRLRVELRGASLGTGGAGHHLEYDGTLVSPDDVLWWSHSEINFWAPARDSANISIDVGAGRARWTGLTWRCSAGCAAADVNDARCTDACNVRECAYDGNDCGECVGSAPQLRDAALAVREDAVGGTLLLPQRPSTEADGALTAHCHGRCGANGEACERVDFALLGVSSPACDGRGASAPFALRPRGPLGFRLRVADDAALDREACDEYEAHVNATNGGGWSMATIRVAIGDANDLRIDDVMRLDGLGLDSLSSRGGTVVVFEGSELGRIDPSKEARVVGSYR